LKLPRFGGACLNRPAMRSANSSVRFLQSIKSACERAIGLATKIGLIEGSAICFLGASLCVAVRSRSMYLFQGRSFSFAVFALPADRESGLPTCLGCLDAFLL
jgi:hypothetical protein